MSEPRKLRVFLCHASQDKPVVRELYQRLLAEGWIDPWLDEEKLLPGQDWGVELTNALLEADAVVVSLSKTSLTKEGYVRKEINTALEKLKEKPEDSNYFIPVRLEECRVPTGLQRWQYVDFFPDRRKERSFQRLLAGLKLRADILGIGKEEKPQPASIERAVIEFGQEIALTVQLPTSQLLEFFRSKAGRFLSTDNMFVVLLDYPSRVAETIRFHLMYESGVQVNWSKQQIGTNIEFVHEIIRTKQSIFLPTRKDVQDWFRQHPKVRHKTKAKCWLGVPMFVRNEVKGVVCVFHPDKENLYNMGDHEVLQTFANLAAIALDNAKLYGAARSEAIAAKQLATLGAAMASLQHRINNTLNIIIPNVTRLRRRIDMQDPANQEILDIIDRNARYTADILARIQIPLQEVGAGTVCVNDLLTEILRSAEMEWGREPSHPVISTKLDLDDSIPLLQVPVGQFAEIIRNLIDNAYRAMKQGGKLTIASKLGENSIEIRVKDTAKGGIPLPIRERVFQHPVPSKEPGHGAGLGLWLSKLMLQGTGGDIAVEETGATGTTMLVEIPVPY